MSDYSREFTPVFLNDLKKIKNNYEVQKRLINKIEEILKNPYHYKPLRNILKNQRRTHIGSYVLIFEIVEEKKIVVFHAFKHHDVAYNSPE